MTPEKAFELKECASPSPWRTDRHPYMGGQRIYEAGNNIIAEGVSGFNADLIAAAPALAELVAGLRYEYAVQVKEGHGYTQYARSYRSLTTELKDALWEDEPNEELAERWWSRLPTCTVRVVRRLAGDPEVVS